MTIHVVTPDHGERSFEADDWNTSDPTNGELWIGHEDSGVGVARFARGAWLFVYEKTDLETEAEAPTPRVWDSIEVVPAGLRVEDREGDPWKYRKGHWHYKMHGQGPWQRAAEYLRDEDTSGPFTEVLMTDVVNHPSHYADGWSNGAEVIDITENLNFNRGNAVKYIARAGKKDPAKELEDLQKAEFYLKREISRVITTTPVGDLPNSGPEKFYQEPSAPSQWKSLNDIPWSVRLSSRIRDTEGDIWRWTPKGWEWASRGAGPWIPALHAPSEHDESGPFVEIRG